MKTVRLLQPPRAGRLPAKLSGVSKMNEVRIMGAIAFSGNVDPDPIGAAAALRRAGFEVTMMPERFRAYLDHPDDYFMEASIAGTHDDKACVRSGMRSTRSSIATGVTAGSAVLSSRIMSRSKAYSTRQRKRVR